MVLGLILTMLSFPAHAQTTVTVYPACRYFAAHVPDADVRYREGIDAAGRPVVPADLNSPPIDVPETVTVPLTIDLEEKLKAGPEGTELEAPIGFLEIDSRTGRVRYNGRDVTPRVYALCGEGASGQGTGDAIKSRVTINE